MAITIHDVPNSYQSLHDDLWFVVSSNNSGQSSFKYVFDVLINNQLVARIKSFPQPVTGRGIFNASPIVRSYLNNYFKPTISTPTLFSYVTSDIRVNYVIQFGEEYGGTTYTNLAEQDTDAFNYYPNIMNGINDFNGINYAAFGEDYPLSRRDGIYAPVQTKYSGGRCFISILNGNINTPSDWRFDVGKPGISNNNGGTVEVSDFAILDVSPAAINNYLGTNFITPDVKSYSLVAEVDGVGGWALNVDVICQPRFEAIPLHFLNALGGYDTFYFSLANREQRAIEKKTFDEIEWAYGNNSMNRANSNGVFYGGSNQFYTSQTITYRLISDWVNYVDYNWLKELIASPEVYMEKTENQFIPVIINTNTWTEKKRFADKTYNLELDIQIASKAYSQFR